MNVSIGDVSAYTASKAIISCQLWESCGTGLVQAIVRPHLEYCIQAWSPYLRKYINMLEKIQRRATKLIPNLTYEERLEECGLTTLDTRRLEGDQIVSPDHVGYTSKEPVGPRVE